MLPSPGGRGAGGEGKYAKGADNALTSPHPPPLPKGEEVALAPSEDEVLVPAGPRMTGGHRCRNMGKTQKGKKEALAPGADEMLVPTKS